jgi:hypothetical protein
LNVPRQGECCLAVMAGSGEWDIGLVEIAGNNNGKIRHEKSGVFVGKCR